MLARYFVLMLHGEPGEPGAVLTTKPVDLGEARRTVRWQTSGICPHQTYPICSYDACTGSFIEIEGEQRTLSIHRGPYTEAAHAAFLESLPHA